jgi:hypothetical protein
VTTHPLIGRNVRAVTARKGDPVHPDHPNLPLAADVGYFGQLVHVDDTGCDVRHPVLGMVHVGNPLAIEEADDDPYA